MVWGAGLGAESDTLGFAGLVGNGLKILLVRGFLRLQWKHGSPVPVDLLPSAWIS